MKRRALIVGLILALTSGLISIVPAQATGATGGDPTGDVFDRLVGYRAAFKKDTAAQGGPLDLTGWGFTTFRDGAGNGWFRATIKTAANWPAEGSLPVALPPGVKTLEARWVFRTSAMNRAEIIGSSCTDKSTAYDNPVDASKFRPVTFANYYCTDVREGPFPGSDGWSFFLYLTVKPVNGKLHWTWSAGWLEEYTAIFYSVNEGQHDPVVPDSLKAKLNGGIFCQPVTSQYNCNTPAATNNIVLDIPYQVRDDLADDQDGLADETRTHYLARPGDTITQVTAATYASAEATVPDPPLCPAKPGEPTEPVFRNLPVGLNDPNKCYSQGAGVTTIFDWAPGDPFTLPNPTWGGFLPRVFPRAIGYAPGPNSATCNYPAGLALGVNATTQALGGNYVPSAIDPKGALTLVNGATIDPPPDGGSSFTVPGANLSANRVELPTGRETACGHIYLDPGLHFVPVLGFTPFSTS